MQYGSPVSICDRLYTCMIMYMYHDVCVLMYPVQSQVLYINLPTSKTASLSFTHKETYPEMAHTYAVPISSHKCAAIGLVSIVVHGVKTRQFSNAELV